VLKISVTTILDAFEKISKRDYYLRHVCPSAPQTAWNNSAPTGRIFMKFYIWKCFENLPRKIKFH